VFFAPLTALMKSLRLKRTSHAGVRTWSATYSRAILVFPFDWEWSHTQFMASKVTAVFFRLVAVAGVDNPDGTDK
jgi:hypothetical protein